VTQPASLPARYFDELYEGDPDPWAFRTRWYEQRKRELILACLPRPHWRQAYEPACANGETSAALAQRADWLLCSDYSGAAVALARERLAGLENVRVEQHHLPQDWPRARFDLIVLGEVGYYLAPDEWRQTCEQALASLCDGGALLACHWRHPIDGCALAGDAVHEVIAEVMQAPPAVRHLERDFRLELWFDEAAS